MKPKNALRNFLALAGSSLIAISSASAQVYWDTDGSTAGFGTASGTWGSDSYWNTSTTGGAGTFSTTTSGAINFGNGATGLGAGTITVDGTQTATGNLTFASGSGAIVLSGGTIDLPATTSITVNNTTNTISSNITGAGTSLTKAGSGTLLLAGTRSGSGLTIITGGTLIARPGSLGSGGITFTTANTTLHFQTDSNLTSNNAIGADSASANRTFVVDRVTAGAAVDVSVTGSGTGNAVAFARNNLISFTKGANITSGTPTFTFRNGIRNQDSTDTTLTSNPNTFSPTDVNVVINGITSSGRTRGYIFQGNSHGNEITGTFANGNGTAVRKAGTGTWTFNGISQYTGQTEINAGTLKFGKQTALYNNTTASWTAANLRVQSGATLAFNVGGTGEFTTGNVTTLLTNLAASSSATNGMNAGSRLGFDTTNAAGGSFTIADVIADTTGSSGGARGLTKLGAGTLVLSNASNTYTGATTISGGSLEVRGALASSGITNNAALIYNNSSAQSYSGAITGTGSLTKQGAGTLNLTGDSNYGGATTISGGTLEISGTGDINGSSGITVDGGHFKYNSSTALTSSLTVTSGTVSGTNLAGVSLTVGDGAIISPGNSPGTMNVAGQTWAPGGTYDWEILDASGAAGTGWDLLAGTGTLNITAFAGTGNTFLIDITSLSSITPDVMGNALNFDNTATYTWLIADFAAITNFAVSAFEIDATGFANPLDVNGVFGISLGGVGTVPGDSSQIYLTYTAIPEPGAALLGGLGMLALLRRRRSA